MFRAGQAQPGNLRQPGDLPLWGDDDAGDGLWVELEEREIAMACLQCVLWLFCKKVMHSCIHKCSFVWSSSKGNQCQHYCYVKKTSRLRGSDFRFLAVQPVLQGCNCFSKAGQPQLCTIVLSRLDSPSFVTFCKAGQPQLCTTVLSGLDSPRFVTFLQGWIALAVHYCSLRAGQPQICNFFVGLDCLCTTVLSGLDSPRHSSFVH